MAGFTVDTNNTQEQQGLIKPGDYEVVIKEVTEGASQQKGTPFIQIELVVRNDVNQEFKNKHLWYTIWDTPATREKGMYAKQINTVSKHAGVQNGASFNSVADWGRFIQGRPVLATVKLEEYNGEQKERVTFINATKFPQCQHSWKQENNNGSQGNNQGSSSSYGQGNQSYNNGGNQQYSQNNGQNYNNGQQGNNNNQGYGNQNGGPSSQGNGYYNNGQNVAGTGQGWNVPAANIQDDDLPF